MKPDTMYALWATKIGRPDYEEQLITEVRERAVAAKAWALANGFDRVRESEIPNDGQAPDFSLTIAR